MSTEFNNIIFDMPKSQSNAIKVIGVGGGGSNAVNYMFQQNIKGVDFVICNTDAQALENSPIPNKIQLGANLTSGLGAGANPETGKQAANESIAEIQQVLNTQTKMVFITAGMGGGTGTGAAPIIAKVAKDMDVLTVGIVTMPFQFEGRMRAKQAQKGIDALRNSVDSLIVINNNKLREVYGNLGYKAGFSKADEVLSTAARGIAEVITRHYKQNIDLHDAKTVLSNSGTAIMGSARETGNDRAKNVIVKALDSPLLNDNKITGAKNVLLLIVCGTNEVTLDEIGEINDYIQTEAGYEANIIMGIGEDVELEDAISVTVVATGFATEQQSNITNTEVKKIVHTLENDQKATYNFAEEDIKSISPLNTPISNLNKKNVYVLEDKNLDKSDKLKMDFVPTPEIIDKTETVHEEVTIEELSENEIIITDVTEQGNEKEVENSQVDQDLLFDLTLNNYEKVRKDGKIDKFRTDDGFEHEGTGAEEIEKHYVIEDYAEISEIETKSEGDYSPLNMTILEMQSRSKERRESMRRFNQFSDQVNKNIDEIEKQPAYKRMGIDLEQTDKIISKSKTTLKSGDDDIQLDSNNSFLHDNVD